MKIGILGPLTVTDDSGASMQLPLEPKQELLLVALAANADRGISVRELAVAVYGSTETDLYKRSIQALVSRLRTALRGGSDTYTDAIPRAKGSFYSPNMPAEEVDSLRFLLLADHLLTHWAGINAGEREELCRQALAEWRDDPVRIYGGASPVAADMFRRYTARLASLGQRYGRFLLEEQRYDDAGRVLGRLVELLPENYGLAHLQQEAAARGSEKESGRLAPSSGSARYPDAMQELTDRLLSSRHLSFGAVAVTAHNLDRIYLVDRVAPDHEVTIDSPFEAPGGSGANTVAALGRLGTAVAAAGIVADDPEGALLLAALADAGVDCRNMLVVPTSQRARSGHSIIFSDPHGVRSIYVHAGVNESLTETLQGTSGALATLEDAIRHARIVHFTSFTSPAELGIQEYLTTVLPTRGVLSLNPGALYASLGLDRLDPILSRANVLFVYEQNLRELVDNSAAPPPDAEGGGIRSDLSRLYGWKRMKGYDEPLVTLVKRFRSTPSGVHGPEYLTVASGRFGVEELIGTQARIGGKSQSSVADSTGAGDGMAAGLHFGLLSGASLRECADLSFVLATMVSEQIGARAGQPTAEALRSGWQTYFPGVAEPMCLRSPAMQ